MNTLFYSRHLVHPVTLLSVAHGDKENIAAMSWVSALSRNPPLLMVAVSPKRYSHQLLLDSQEFAINILKDNQNELSTLAGTHSGRNENKWESEPFRKLRKTATKIGVPVLKDCLAVFECKLEQHIPTGDHTLFVGEIVHSESQTEANPLVLFNRQYFQLGNFVSKYP